MFTQALDAIIMLHNDPKQLQSHQLMDQTIDQNTIDHAYINILKMHLGNYFESFLQQARLIQTKELLGLAGDQVANFDSNRDWHAYDFVNTGEHMTACCGDDRPDSIYHAIFNTLTDEIRKELVSVEA